MTKTRSVNEERLESLMTLIRHTQLEEGENQPRTLYDRLHRVTEVAIQCLHLAHHYRAQLQESHADPCPFCGPVRTGEEA